MNAGYVYVLAFSNGTVKVGQTQDLGSRFDSHERTARSFGLTVTGRWESPLHDGWLENEQALMRIARELGGQPTTPEYFNGVSFDALTAKARELPFPVPADKAQAAAASRHSGGTPTWLKDELAVCRARIAAGWYDADGTLQHLTDQVLRDRDFARLLVERYVRKSLKAGVKREDGGSTPPPDVPAPEPPDSEPPQAGGAADFCDKVRPLLRGDLTVSDVLEQLAKAA